MELHQQWLFQHRTAKQVCPPYHAGLYGDIQMKINISHHLLQQSRPTLTSDTLRKNITNSYIIQNTITWHKEAIISYIGLVWTPVLYQEARMAHHMAGWGTTQYYTANSKNDNGFTKRVAATYKTGINLNT
jgi:hypothetical protein